MHKVKSNNSFQQNTINSNRNKSSKIRNADTNSASANSLVNQSTNMKSSHVNSSSVRRSSKSRLDDIHEKQVMDPHNMSFDTESNYVTVVKETEKHNNTTKSTGTHNKNSNRKHGRGGHHQKHKTVVINDQAEDMTTMTTGTKQRRESLISILNYGSNENLINKRRSSNLESQNLNTGKSIKEKWKIAYKAVKSNMKKINKPYDEVNEEDDEENEDDLLSSGGTNFNLSINAANGAGLVGRRSTVIDGNTQRRYTKDSMGQSVEDRRRFNNNNSYIRSAIPSLPLVCAIICFLLNIILPGTGTILCGIFALCFGEARVDNKTGVQTSTTFIVNFMVGIFQMSTVVLLLVGWFWSFGWGVYMMILSLERRRQAEVLIKRKKNRELKANALKALGGLKAF